MNLFATIEIYGGGPGSGCAGPNCGRPKEAHEINRDGGFWGFSHGNSRAISWEAAKLMGISGYDEFQAVPRKFSNIAKKFLTAIAKDKEGSEEKLYHGFQNIGKKQWVVGNTLKISLTSTAGDLDDSSGYGIRLDPRDQDGEPTVFEFDKGTPMSGYSRWSPADQKEFGHKWEEAIVAGEFKITGLRKVKERAWRERDIQVVSLSPTKVFDPETSSWRDR